MKRGRTGSIDLFSDQSYSIGASPSSSSSSPARHGGGEALGRTSSARSDGGGSAAGAAAGGGMGGGMDDEATRQKVLHAERMRIAMANMSEGQKERFEFFRRSHFHRDTIKKIMLESFSRIREGSTYPRSAAVASAAAPGRGGDEGGEGLGVDMNEQMVIVMSALCKLFVGDLVHGARQVMEERGEDGAIAPARLREALRRAVREKRLPVMRGALRPPLPPFP
ncbi:tafii28-like protein [Nannochloropsis oceanica]